MIEKPHDYQRENIKSIIEKFKEHDKLCYQLDTGGGKTVVFSFLSKYWRDVRKQKVLILCHSEDLVSQACDTLVQVGLTYEKILSTTKRLNHKSDVYVAMIETLDRRLKKNSRYLCDIGLVIADEAHVQIFNKVYSYFSSKILGVTATPVLLGRDTYYKCDRCRTEYEEVGMCCNRELMEWSRPKRMSNVYDDIVIGPKIDFLIEFGQLVKEINFIQKYADLSSLEIDSTGEYSNESQDKAFGSSESVFNVALNYEQLAKGKRTIIFNNSTKTNLKVYDEFKEKGYTNVKLYDSVNDSGESRKSIVKWFKETPDAILLNCGVFVAGFDCKDIECVMLNVATTSLSRYLQMCGRGGRASSLIYKPHFIIIDGGGNVERFDPWSAPTRDWDKIFREGIGKDRAKKEQPLNVQECKECGMYFSRSDSICPECGTSVPTPKPRDKTLSSDVLTPLEKLPPPNGKKIADYTARREENIHFGFKILGEYILDMFRFYGVDADLFGRSLSSGKVDKRIAELVRPVYFTLIKDERFSGDSNRTIKQVCKVVKKKICNYYNIVVD